MFNAQNNRLKWYLHRLKAMSILEIGYRFQQRLQIARDRGRLKNLMPDNMLWQGLGQTGPTDWNAWEIVCADRPNQFPWIIASNAVSFREKFPDETSEIIKAAKETRDGSFVFFDHISVDRPQNFSWHKDLLTEKQWPSDTFYADIGHRWGGAKTIWEPARHQNWICLAQAYWLTEDISFFQALHQQFTSWFEQNRPYNGVHWTSGLEIAIRLISWFWIDEFIPTERWDAEYYKQWSTHIVLAGQYLSKHFSKYSSANNHLIGEAMGLFIAGVMLPEWHEADKWITTATITLLDELPKQILEDGGGAEQASHYLGFIVDFFLLFAALDENWKGQFDNTILQTRLKAVGKFIRGIMDTNGNLPAYGDEDGGYAYILTQSMHLTYSRLIAISSYTASPESKPTREYDAHTWFLFGEEGQNKYNRIKQKTTHQDLYTYPQTGYFALHGSNNKANLLFDCGNLGYLSLAAHGHADCLSIWLSLGGEPFLVDGGTYKYHEELEWRYFFRSTAAHNTIRIDKKDQSEQTGPTIWGNRAKSSLINCKEHPGFIWIEGSHDGYHHIEKPIIHRRGVGLVDAKYYVIVDWLIGEGQHEIERFFHFSHKAKVTINNSCCEVVLGTQKLNLLLDHGNGVTSKLVKGQDNPILGWQSTQFYKKLPTTTLLSKYDGPCPSSMVTVIWPGLDPAPIFQTLSPINSTSIFFALSTNEWQDTFFFDIEPPIGEIILDGEKCYDRIGYIRKTSDNSIKKFLTIR